MKKLAGGFVSRMPNLQRISNHTECEARYRLNKVRAQLEHGLTSLKDYRHDGLTKGKECPEEREEGADELMSDVGH